MSSRFIPQEIIEAQLASDPELSAGIDAVYAALEDRMSVEEFHRRHMTQSLGILTVTNPATARRIVKPLRARLLNKTVVEVGAGVGFLALEIARYSPRVFAIESDPGWSWLFTQFLYDKKPSHLTWIFGRAEEVSSWLRADVAIIATRSGHDAMRRVAGWMAKEVIEVYPTGNEGGNRG